MHILRSIIAVVVIIGAASLLIALFVVGVTDEYAANRDFVQYWAAGRELIHHANPYDRASMLAVERGAGMQEDEPHISISPPAAMCLLLPLGLVSAKVGLISWALATIISVLVAIWMIWLLNGRPDSALHLSGYLFAPVVACLLLGQMGTFLLLGLALFLYLKQDWPFLAGAALLPCVWKPHLFLPFFIVLLLWSVDRRQLRVLAGFVTAVLASSALTMYFDPHIWSHYWELMAGTRGELRGYVPTLSVTLRFKLAPHAVWLQYVPELAVCVWAVWYFWTRRDRWNWMDQGSWVLLVSTACTPYGWFTDEAILLPALLFAVYRAVESGRSLIPIALIAFIALMEVCAFGHIASTHYLWTVPAWLGWYLYATWNRGDRAGSACSPAEIMAG